jgi:hypothetical protein
MILDYATGKAHARFQAASIAVGLKVRQRAARCWSGRTR